MYSSSFMIANEIEAFPESCQFLLLSSQGAVVHSNKFLISFYTIYVDYKIPRQSNKNKVQVEIY